MGRGSRKSDVQVAVACERGDAGLRPGELVHGAAGRGSQRIPGARDLGETPELLDHAGRDRARSRPGFAPFDDIAVRFGKAIHGARSEPLRRDGVSRTP